MLFNSLEFLIVLPVLLLLTLVFRKHFTIQKYILLCSSLFFYAYWNVSFLGLLLLSCIVNYSIGWQLENHKKNRKKYFYLGIGFNIALLFAFKYWLFFYETSLQIASLFNINLGKNTWEILLPIGISFYTFHAISYLVDVYQQKVTPIKNGLDFGLFLSFIPLILAGPIERTQNLYPQLQKKFVATQTQLKEGFYLIVLGLFQKLFIGDACGKIVDAIYSDFSSFTTDEILCTCVLFSFQIYADFCGYSNMAKGIGLLFGVHLTTNFKQPYLSKNIQEFWRRWHISLSTWFRDYVYIPLGGNQKGSKKTMLNICIVFLLAGLWHGAGWNFIVWGAYHALLLLMYPVVKPIKLNSYLAIGITFILVSIGWVFFRIESWQQFEIFVQKLTHFSCGNYTFRYIKMIITFGLVLFLIDGLQIKLKSEALFSSIKNQYFAQGIAITVFLTCVVYIITNQPHPFIYFQF